MLGMNRICAARTATVKMVMMTNGAVLPLWKLFQGDFIIYPTNMTVKCSHVGHEPEVIEDSSEGVPDEDPRGDAAEDGAHDLRARVSC